MVRTCHAICFVSTWSNFWTSGRRKFSGRDHSNASSAVLSHLSSGTICVECSSNCRVCGRNPIGWPFKLNLLSFIHLRNEIVCFPVLAVTVKSRLSVSVEQYVYCNSMTVLKGADWNKMKANEQYVSVVLFLLWCDVYEIIHIWTAVVDESEQWATVIIAVNFQFKQLERRSLKKKSGLQRDSNPWPPRCRKKIRNQFLLCCKRWWVRGVIFYSVTIP